MSNVLFRYFSKGYLNVRITIRRCRYRRRTFRRSGIRFAQQTGFQGLRAGETALSALRHR